MNNFKYRTNGGLIKIPSFVFREAEDGAVKKMRKEKCQITSSIIYLIVLLVVCLLIWFKMNKFQINF